MSEIWFISDTHFFHERVLTFKDSQDKLIRPGFKNASEMNEVLITNWNRTVQPKDHVYHLGDVALGYGGDDKVLGQLLSRLNGKLRLVVGNHDNLKSPALHAHFEKIMLWRGFKDGGFTCSHIPLRADEFRDGIVNVHGHTHQKILKDPIYLNVCVENTAYTPVHYEYIRKYVESQR